MNATTRKSSVLYAIMREKAGIAFSVEGEQKAGVLGWIYQDEVEKLVQDKKWTQELAETARKLGLIRERTSPKKGFGEGGSGAVQKRFEESYPKLFNGDSSVNDEQALAIVTKIGLKRVAAIMRNISKETPFVCNTYYSIRKTLEQEQE